MEHCISLLAKRFVNLLKFKNFVFAANLFILGSVLHSLESLELLIKFRYLMLFIKLNGEALFIDSYDLATGAYVDYFIF